jgi:hypothetical protein
MIVQVIWAYDLLRCFEDDIRSDLGSINAATASGDFGELDVKSHQLIFSRYDHEAPGRGAVDQAPVPDIS